MSYWPWCERCLQDVKLWLTHREDTQRIDRIESYEIRKRGVCRKPPCRWRRTNENYPRRRVLLMPIKNDRDLSHLCRNSQVMKAGWLRADILRGWTFDNRRWIRQFHLLGHRVYPGKC